MRSRQQSLPRKIKSDSTAIYSWGHSMTMGPKASPKLLSAPQARHATTGMPLPALRTKAADTRTPASPCKG